MKPFWQGLLQAYRPLVQARERLEQTTALPLANAPVPAEGEPAGGPGAVARRPPRLRPVTLRTGRLRLHGR